jgi:hypothetical protein
MDIQVWICTFKRITGVIRWVFRGTQREVVVLFLNRGSTTVVVVQEEVQSPWNIRKTLCFS